MVVTTELLLGDGSWVTKLEGYSSFSPQGSPQAFPIHLSLPHLSVGLHCQWGCTGAGSNSLSVEMAPTQLGQQHVLIVYPQKEKRGSLW